ncbi:AAA family ATPase [Candidatus Falkowbacteria bacterium]|nr:AAA family ATPase [Candidatus Falkowbacteria bacterium]
MIITVTGTVGSGKSTIAQNLAKELGFERIYVGGIRREIAKQRGVTLEEYNTWSQTHPEGDIEVDNKIKELMIGKDNVVLEGRVMHHFFPTAFKIYVTCDIEVAAQRILKDVQEGRRDEEGTATLQEVMTSITTREHSDALRYQKYYNLNIHDTSVYDFVLNTTHLSPQEALDATLTAVQNT